MCICITRPHWEGTLAKRSGPPFTKRTDALPQDLVKFRSREIPVSTSLITLQFDRDIDSIAAKMPVKFYSDTIIMTYNLGASRLYEISRSVVLSYIETGPRI